MANLRKTLQMLGTIAAVSGMFAASPAPAAAQGSKPCAPKSGKMSNPCGPKDKKAAHPCAPKSGNPCAAKK